MLQHFPEKIVTNDRCFAAGRLYFSSPKPKICKKVYFRAKKRGQGRF